MCLFPKRILNRSRQFDPEYSPLYFDVPCGKCEECLKEHVNEYIMRADAEFDYNTSLGGDILFLTLTYASEFLPVTNGVMHFDTSHIRDFFKRLRVNMSRAGFDAKNIRYFLVAEYGGKNKRPHYHVEIYFPYKVNSWDFINCYTNKGIFQRSWIYGNCSYSTKHGAYVNTKACNRYVCKYLAKFEDFYKQAGSIELVKECPQAKPFHRQSKGFGKYILSQLSQWEILNGVKRVITKKGFYLQKLPTYIQRKLYYTYDNVTCLFRLNQLGLMRKLDSLYKYVDVLSEKFSHIFHKDYREIQAYSDEILKETEYDCLDTLVLSVRDNVKRYNKCFSLSYLMKYFVKTNIIDSYKRLVDYYHHLYSSPYLPNSPLTPHIADLLFGQTYQCSLSYQQFKPIYDAYEIYRKYSNLDTQLFMRDNRKYQETLQNYLS